MEHSGPIRAAQIAQLLTEAKALARRYRDLTGRPLGITGEVAEFAAANALGLDLADVRQSGYDATRQRNGKVERIQIKGRCLPRNAKPGQRLGSIQLDKEWDAVILVLLDEDLELTEIYEAGRKEVTEALMKPGSKSRNERGALGVNQFKSVGTLVYAASNQYESQVRKK